MYAFSIKLLYKVSDNFRWQIFCSFRVFRQVLIDR